MSSVRRLNKSIYIESRPAAGGAQVIPLCGAVWYTIPYNRQGKRAVYEAEQAIFSPSAGGGVLAGGLAGRSDGHRAGGVFGITGAGAAHLGAAAAKGGFLAAGVLQLRAHFAGFCAGCSGQRGAGGVRRLVERRRCAAGSGDAAGQGYAGGKLYHSGTGLGAGQRPFGAYQLSDGATGAVRRGAHRYCRGRRAAAGNGRGVPSACRPPPAGDLAACGAAGLPAGVQRGTGHLLEKRRGGRGHRLAQRQHRRCAVPCQDHPFHRGTVCVDLCHHSAERRL